MNALVFGASGELARAITSVLLEREWHVDCVTRRASGNREFLPNCDWHFVESAYTEYQPSELHDAYFFPQATFLRRPIVETSADEIESMVRVGLTDLMICLRNVLAFEVTTDRRIDYCIIGSTSSYAGFRDTAVYCAVKHALVGLVRALNDEYAATNRRFRIVSMGTMDTAMGRELVEQDPSSFLPCVEVARRIVATTTEPLNLFEPEVIIRRRVIRMKDQ